MKKFGLLLWIGLGLCLAACVPAEKPAPLPLPAATSLATPRPGSPATLEPTAPPLLPLATSRGDQLEASDPASVQLGAGKPVLVEFFRFT